MPFPDCSDVEPFPYSLIPPVAAAMTRMMKAIIITKGGDVRKLRSSGEVDQ